MSYSVRIEVMAGSRATAIVRRGASMAQLPKVIPEACGIVWNLTKARGIKGGRHVAVYLDDEMNLEIGVEVESPIQGDEELIASSLPAGRVASTVHFGPYPKLGAAHQAMVQGARACAGRAMLGGVWALGSGVGSGSVEDSDGCVLSVEGVVSAGCHTDSPGKHQPRRVRSFATPRVLLEHGTHSEKQKGAGALRLPLEFLRSSRAGRPCHGITSRCT
jgi:hypothetical protein